METVKRVLTVVLVAGLASVGLGSAAHATQRTCAVNGAYWWLPNTCYTDSVAAHLVRDSSGKLVNGWVTIGVYPYSGCGFDYKVRDIANNVVVYSGHASGGLNKSIFGLYSYYRLEGTRTGGSGCGGDLVIQNESVWV